MRGLNPPGLSAKTVAALSADGITTLEQLQRRSRSALLGMPGIGPSRRAEIEAALLAAGLRNRDQALESRDPLLNKIKAILSLHFTAKARFELAASALAKLIQSHAAER